MCEVRQLLVGILVTWWVLPLQVFAESGYPEQVRQNFLTACISSCKLSETIFPEAKAIMQDYCQCVLEQLETTLSIDDYLQWELDIVEGKQADPSAQKRFDEATRGCLPPRK